MYFVQMLRLELRSLTRQRANCRDGNFAYLISPISDFVFDLVPYPCTLFYKRRKRTFEGNLKVFSTMNI